MKGGLGEGGGGRGAVVWVSGEFVSALETLIVMPELRPLLSVLKLRGLLNLF